MRTLTHTVCPEDAGRTVLFCLKKYFGLAEGAVSRLKWQPGGIVLNGEPARVTVRVRAGDVLVEYDKLIDRQLERAAITSISGFGKICDGAAKVLNV